MCLSTPDMPEPPKPPAPPPPPTKTAEKVSRAADNKKGKKKSGVSSLTIKRQPTTNTNTQGTGTNIKY